jgi:NAD dependent epimerase/dehydratase
MTWQNRPVLVTGAGGFIGSHLVERLVGEGAQVTAFIRYTSRAEEGWLSALPEPARRGLQVIRGDLRDDSAVAAAMSGCDTVFHLGALIAIPYSYVHPREVVDVNVMGTLNVLEAARRLKPRRIVHTSTSEVYGTARTSEIAETHPLQAQSPYSASKIAADKIAESYYRAFDVPVTVLRPFNTFGPRQSLRGVIPTIIAQALHRPEIRLGSLWPVRDFTYVDDTIDGYLGAGIADVVGEEINLGTGTAISIGELAGKILALIGRSLPVITEDERKRPEKSEVGRLLSDNALARRKLGWSPRVSLDEGLARTIAWMRESGTSSGVERYAV